jgi:PEP-CTERM motif
MSRLGLVLRRTGIICALIGWFSSSVAADPIRSTLRFIQGSVAAETPEGSFGIFASDDGTDLPGLFNSVLTDEVGANFGLPTVASYTATQHTDVSATRWSGSGTASTFTLEGDPSFVGTASAESFMTIEFSLAEPMSYLLTGTIIGEGGLAAISLDGPPGLGWLFESGNAVPLVAMRRGLLSPGEYVFDVRAESGSSRTGTSVFDVQFTLADPVPEPATLPLFGSGAAFVARRAWRRRREQSAS